MAMTLASSLVLKLTKSAEDEEEGGNASARMLSILLLFHLTFIHHFYKHHKGHKPLKYLCRTKDDFKSS